MTDFSLDLPWPSTTFEGGDWNCTVPKTLAHHGFTQQHTLMVSVWFTSLGKHPEFVVFSGSTAFPPSCPFVSLQELSGDSLQSALK